MLHRYPQLNNCTPLLYVTVDVNYTSGMVVAILRSVATTASAERRLAEARQSKQTQLMCRCCMESVPHTRGNNHTFLFPPYYYEMKPG
jgi:hypothetical protein